jgi:hypothetical protein
MSKKFPLVVEPHPADYHGYEFLTLIRFNDESSLNIVDNVSKKYIHTYVIDLCGPEGFDEETLIDVANEWYHSNGDQYPISVEFSRRNMIEQASSILRAYPLDYVTRVIGPLPYFDMSGPIKVRKRKRKEISPGVEIVRKRLKQS